MKEKTNIKFILSAIYFILLQTSALNTCVTIGGLVSAVMFKVKGFYLVLLGSLIYMHSAYTKKKNEHYISLLLILLGYSYTFYTIFKLDTSDFIFKSGFYIYVASLIFFIISLFIGNEEKIESIDTKIVENNTVEKYIVGTYLYGVKGKPEYSNHTCALTINKDSNDLIAMISLDQILNINIKYEQIEKITVKQGMSIKSNKGKMLEDHTTADTLLATALVGVWGPMIAQNLNESISYSKTNYSIAYTVEIIYKENEEDKKLVIEFPKNPDYFFKNFESIYEKNS